MKKILVLLVMVLLAAPDFARADGTTDITISPSATTTIASPGSYRLAADVTMTENIGAVSITASDVVFDLNGHTIQGAPGNGAQGINGSAADNVTILNGAVKQFGGWGIQLRDRAVVRDCRAIGNNSLGGSGGISVQTNSAVEHCMVSGNNASAGTVTAILTNVGCLIADNIVEGNTGPNANVIGIHSNGNNCIVRGNIVRSNQTDGGNMTGISAGNSNQVRGNTVSINTNTGSGNCTGISAGIYSVVDGNLASHQTAAGTGISTGITGSSCTITNNDCANNSGTPSTNATARGINAGGNCLVRGNRCEGNNAQGTGNGAGIVAANGCRVEANYCSLNSGGGTAWGISINGSGVLVIGNSTYANKTGGMIFSTASNNRAESNRMRETVGIDPSGSSPTVGAGDLANVVY